MFILVFATSLYYSSCSKPIFGQPGSEEELPGSIFWSQWDFNGTAVQSQWAWWGDETNPTGNKTTEDGTIKMIISLRKLAMCVRAWQSFLQWWLYFSINHWRYVLQLMKHLKVQRLSYLWNYYWSFFGF